jgi:uncharacterized protein YbjT (DUF2867 family)
MKTVLITDAEGLVGAFTVTALLKYCDTGSNTTNDSTALRVLAGYHSEDSVTKAKSNTLRPVCVTPVLIDWNNPSTWTSALQEADGMLLLTPFTSNKAAQVADWMSCLSATPAKSSSPFHVVHVGIHTDTSVSAESRPPHENWFLEAENEISKAAVTKNLSFTNIRLNFDGYNGVLHPGAISYFLPVEKAYGWMAREDIAAFMAHVLAKGGSFHDRNTYRLSGESLSLADMARNASLVMDSDIIPVETSVADFENMATLGGPKDAGYLEYVASVASMFNGLRKGLYNWHTEVFVEEFEKVMRRKPMTFKDWLENATLEMKTKLIKRPIRV